MKTIPILFSTPMVQALQAGTKTQTRRVVKFSKKAIYNLSEGESYELTRMQDGYADGTRPVFGSDDEPNLFSVPCPYGAPGDILWVRETWAELKGGHNEVWIEYKADGLDNHGDSGDWDWKPSIFMPKTACRLFLKVKSIRVERLQSITEADAVAEGLEKWLDGNFKAYTKDAGKFENAVPAYRSLWQSINGPGSWEANPYVWVVEFEKCDKPENF